jgi:hypothetical protein
MKSRALVQGCLVAVGLCVTGVGWADCHHSHKAYPQGGGMCLNGFEFRCGSLGAWRKTLNHCSAPSGTQLAPASAQPDRSGAPAAAANH